MRKGGNLAPPPGKPGKYMGHKSSIPINTTNSFNSQASKTSTVSKASERTAAAARGGQNSGMNHAAQSSHSNKQSPNSSQQSKHRSHSNISHHAPSEKSGIRSMKASHQMKDVRSGGGKHRGSPPLTQHSSSHQKLNTVQSSTIIKKSVKFSETDHNEPEFEDEEEDEEGEETPAKQMDQIKAEVFSEISEEKSSSGRDSPQRHPRSGSSTMRSIGSSKLKGRGGSRNSSSQNQKR